MANLADRIAQATEMGEEALWEQVARLFPEAKSGDLDPLTTHDLTVTIRKAITSWTRANLPAPFLTFRNDHGDDVVCSCGNDVGDSGFHPVTIKRPAGQAIVTECDPTPYEWPLSLMRCGRCGAVYHESPTTGRYGETIRGEYV